MTDKQCLEQSQSNLVESVNSKTDLTEDEKLMFEEYQELIYSLGYMPRPE